ncbi:MAG: amidohydrolase family protein [Lapillicoccus sp.]
MTTADAAPSTPPSRTALTGRVVTPDADIREGVVVVEEGLITYAGPAGQVPPTLRDLPTAPGWAPGRILLPGLVDGHCHGGAGGEFGADRGGALAAMDHHHRSGTTTLVGSLVSHTPAALLAGVATCAGLVADGDLAGIHLEGPFLSLARRGAQNPAALTDVDAALVEALVQTACDASAPDAIVQMTYAPERRGGDELPRLLSRLGILPALGHTDADVDVALASLRLGADVAPRGHRPLVTHVFNGMPPLHHRSPGPVAACLGQAAAGAAVLEVIGDGVHLSAGTVRMLFEVVGPDGIDLITDAMAASGMPDGTYTLGGQDVIVADRTARLAEGGSIAGGVTTLLDVVRWCVAEAGIALRDAVTAASATPAATMALAGVGRLRAGYRADVLVVDDDLYPVEVMRGGTWL